MKEKICARQVTTSDPVASEPAFGSGEGEGLGRMQRKSAQEALGAAFVTLTLRRGIEITLFTMTMVEKHRRMDYVIYYDYTRKRMDYVLQHSSIKQLSTLLRSS